MFSINTALIYLAAPVLYVGIVQAALCKRLQAPDIVANLPASVYLWATPVPVLIAWYFPYVRLFKPLLCGAYACRGVVTRCPAASSSLTRSLA